MIYIICAGAAQNWILYSNNIINNIVNNAICDMIIKVVKKEKEYPTLLFF